MIFLVLGDLKTNCNSCTLVNTEQSLPWHVNPAFMIWASLAMKSIFAEVILTTKHSLNIVLVYEDCYWYTVFWKCIVQTRRFQSTYSIFIYIMMFTHVSSSMTLILAVPTWDCSLASKPSFPIDSHWQLGERPTFTLLGNRHVIAIMGSSALYHVPVF